MMPDWEIELNNHIEIFKHPDLEWEEYVPFLVAKRMIEQRIAAAQYTLFLEWRGIEGEACPACSGAGVRMYANTATWRGGIGGNALTSDVCDKCWGSGSKDEPWSSWRIRQPTTPPAAHDSQVKE